MKFGQRVAAFARAHAGCSAHHNPALYLEAVAPPADRTTAWGAAYFLASPPSTCALFASRCQAAGGCDDEEINGSYSTRIGSAVGNVQTVAMRRRAWEPGMPNAPFEEGDIPIIDGPPYGVHVIVCVEDCVVQPDGSWRGRTVQGGQADGGVQAFDSTWHFRDGKLYAGDSQRHVIGVARAAKMRMDDDVRVEDDKTRSPTLPEIAPT